MSKGLKADRIWGTRNEAMAAIAVTTQPSSAEERGAVSAVALMFNSADSTIQQGVNDQRALHQFTQQRAAQQQPSAPAASAAQQRAAEVILNAGDAAQDVEARAAALAAAVDSKLSGEGVEWVGDARNA